MPSYLVELEGGKKYQVEAESPPTEEDIQQYLGGQAPPEKSKPLVDISDTLSGAAHALSGLPTTVPHAYHQLSEGLENPWQRSESYKASAEAQRKYQEETEAAEKAAEESGDASWLGSGMRQAGQSLGFSGGAMGASLVGGSAAGSAGRYLGGLASPAGAVAGEVAGRTLGALGASYGAAYRMAGAQFLDDARDELEAKFQQHLGRPMTEQEQAEAYAELKPLAEKFGHAEAGPEAIGNLALGLGGRYVLGLGRKKLVQLANQSLLKTGAKKLAAGLGAEAVELGGETATQVEQKRIEAEKQALLQGKDPNSVVQPDRSLSEYGTALGEIAPATVAQSLLGLGAGTAYKGIKSAVTPSTPQQPETSVGGEPTPVNIQTPVVSNGQTIAYIPQGSDLTPDDVAEFADDPETLKTMARAGKITLPKIVTPVDGVDPAITQEMNDNVAAGAALAPGTVEALQASQAATAEVSTEPGEFTPTPVKAPGETDNSISEPKSEELISNLLGLPTRASESEASQASSDMAKLTGNDPADLTLVRSGNSKVFFNKKTGEYIKLAPFASPEKMADLQQQIDFLAANGAERFAILPKMKVLHDSGIAVLSQPPAGIEGLSVIKRAGKDFTQSDQELFKELQGQNPLSTNTNPNPLLRVETDSALKNMGLVLGQDGRVRTAAFDFDGFSNEDQQTHGAAAAAILKSHPDMPGVPLAAFSPKVQELVRASSPQVSAQDQVASQLGHEGNRKLWTSYIDKVRQWAERNPEKARLIAENAQDVRVAVVGGTSDSARNHTARGDLDLVFDDNIADPDVRDAISSLQTNTVSPVHQPMMANLDNNAAAGRADASDTRIDAKQAILDALTGRQVSPVTTATETPSNAANVAGGSQSVQTEPAEGSIPAVTAPIVPAQGETSTAEIQPTQDHAAGTKIIEEGVRAEPAPGDQSREVESPESRDSVLRAEESGREEVAPNINVWAPRINEPAAANINGHPVVGTVGVSQGPAGVTFHYNWNGKPQTAVVPFSRLSRPVTALSEAPRYIYTQEQNSRKAGKHIPVTPGVHENFNFRQAFASMAEDKSLSRIYQEIARLLSKMPQFANMDLHIVADGRKEYAGEYSHTNGRSAISINLRQVARGKVDALGTLLHEALHHVTLAKIRNPQGDVELEAAHVLNTIRQKVAKLPGAEKFGYELKTNEEFITGVLTHPGFQDFLAGLPASVAPGEHAGKFRSLLSEVFRRIAELATGKHVAPGSTLDQSMASILALFETPHHFVDTGKLKFPAAVESKPEGYRSPADLLADTAAKMRGEKSEKPAGLNSMFNPKEGRPATGERTLFETPKKETAKPIDLTTAYQKAQPGRSTAWVPIKDVYEQAKAADPSLMPETFMAHINEQNDTGGIMVSPVENVATVEAARPFVVGGAGVEMLVPETAASEAEKEEPAFKPPPGFAFTRARFAPTKPEQQTIKVEGDEGATKKAYDWINAVGPLQAANLILTNRTPGWMTGNEQTIAVSGLIAGLTNVSTDAASTEDEKTVARATAQRLGVKWKDLGAEAAREMRQRGVQNGETLQPIATVLAAEEVLADRGKKVLEKQFDGGEEGATTATAGAAEKATADADERLENIISRLMGSMSPKLTAKGALAKMFRGKGQRDAIAEEVGKALAAKARGTIVTPERKTALTNLVSSLKSTLGASMKGDKLPAPERTMQDLLTSAFVNQVSEGPLFNEAWKEGRQKVLDMLIDMELDKQYHPAEARLKDLRAKLAHLEAGNVDQQKASAAERAALATQITDTKAEMKSAMAAVTAMTPQFEAQRDKLMPAAPTVAFDPVASREAISRAFEKAGYTAELATGLDKSGKRALSIKDALLNRKRATDAVMKQFDEAMAAKDATTQHDWPQARALAERAVNETLNSWQKQLDEDKAAKLQATKDNLLSEDSKALEKLVNSVRGKIAPDEDWSDILHDLPRTQDERLAAIKERVAKHEALKGLTPDEAAKLAENIDKLWQRERLKAFQDELLKAGVLKAGSTKAAANVVSAAPELLRLMNLGVFNSSTFREAVSKRFGIKMMSNTQAQALRKMASEAWEQPQGVLRNRKLKQLLEGIQHVTGSSWSEVVSSYWIASVLSGLNTQFNTWGAVLNGAATNLIQAGAQLVRGNGAAAVGAQLQWWKALNDGMKEALHILWTGDTSFTKRFEQDIHNALDGEKGAHPIAIGERMWKEGTVIQKVPGALMMLVGRSMVAADHVNNIATTQGAMAVARAMNPELYEGKSSFTQKEINDARQQALNETTGGADPANGEERRIVGVRTREILNSGLSQEHREQASLVGDQAAFQNDPTGLFGSIYRAVKTGLSSKVRHLDEVAQDEEVNKIARALAAVGAGSVYAATGTRFMRYGFNLGNEFIRYMPGSWVLNKVAPILGRNLGPMQQDLLIGKNLVGAMALAALYAMFGGGDDEDKDGEWHLEGPWDALSPDEKNERRTAGKAPNTMWKIENGEIKRIGYGQWALAGLIGATGSMLDEKRYEPEKWKERGVAGHMLRGAVTGLYQLQNVAALENLAKMLGQSPSNSSDKIQGPADRLAEMGTAYAGGFAPTFLKDLDKWDDPRNFKAEGAWEKLVREMPVARRNVNDGRPQFNRIGQDVRVHREPYSRLFTSDEVDKPTAIYGHLLSRGLDFPSPSTDRKIIKDGRKVPMETLGKGVTYNFEKAVAVQYGKFLAEHGEELLKMPTKVADKAINTRARHIIDLEVRKVQAKVNTP